MVVTLKAVMLKPGQELREVVGRDIIIIFYGDAAVNVCLLSSNFTK